MIFLIIFREKAFQRLPEPFDVSFIPWKVSEIFIEIEVEITSSSAHDVVKFQLAIDSGMFGNQYCQRVADRREVFLADFTLGGKAELDSEYYDCCR